MEYKTYALVTKLKQNHDLNREEFSELLACKDVQVQQLLYDCARETTEEHFEKKVYVRGLIEFSNYCKNDCYYCGLRKGNHNAQRFRLTKEEILKSCEIGYKLGMRTFVLQSGEDKFYSDDIICELVSSIKTLYPDCALTLSIGEKKKESYKRYFDAGADRYLLRQEAANPQYYSKIHPVTMSCENRLQCLKDLKEIGFQVGAGFMVDAPYQTESDIIMDFRFMQQLKPHMIGIGPFIAHKDTPYNEFPNGDAELTLTVLSITRLLFPDALIPATTALGTLSEDIRTEAFLAGANVIMPNISPLVARENYKIYEDKANTDFMQLKQNIEAVGLELEVSRGDHRDFRK